MVQQAGVQQRCVIVLFCVVHGAAKPCLNVGYNTVSG
jgi:hypothetical protein